MPVTWSCWKQTPYNCVPRQIPFLPSGSSSPTLCTTHPRRRERLYQLGNHRHDTIGHPVDSLARYKENSIGIIPPILRRPEQYTIWGVACLRYLNARDHRSDHDASVDGRKWRPGQKVSIAHHKGSCTCVCKTWPRAGRSRLVAGEPPFALLDLQKPHKITHPDLHCCGNGRHESRGEDWSREELHRDLRKGFPSAPYTASTAWPNCFHRLYACQEDGFFQCPPTMQVYIRDLQDPFCVFGKDGLRGGVNIIGLGQQPFLRLFRNGRSRISFADGRFQNLRTHPGCGTQRCNMLIDNRLKTSSQFFVHIAVPTPSSPLVKEDVVHVYVCTDG